MKQRTRSDTEQAILDALAEVPAGVWVARHLGHSRSLHELVARLWRQRFPDRRNRPAYGHIQHALTRLVDEGLVERKDGEHDTYYRKAH